MRRCVAAGISNVKRFIGTFAAVGGIIDASACVGAIGGSAGGAVGEGGLSPCTKASRAAGSSLWRGFAKLTSLAIDRLHNLFHKLPHLSCGRSLRLGLQNGSSGAGAF